MCVHLTEKGAEDTEKEPVPATTKATPAIPRVGVPMMGGGGGAILAEMRAKRSTMMTKVSLENYCPISYLVSTLMFIDIKVVEKVTYLSEMTLLYTKY